MPKCKVVSVMFFILNKFKNHFFKPNSLFLKIEN